MHITLEDIFDMASPGWGEGSDSDLEILDLEVLEDFGEIEEKDSEVEKDEEDGPPAVRYDGRGRREGMSTLDICTRLKNDRMTIYTRLSLEFQAILEIYPKNGVDLKILLRLAAGFPYQEIAGQVNRSLKTIKNAAKRLRQFRDTGIVKLLLPDQVLEGVALMGPLPKSNAGRKPRAQPHQQTAIIVDLFGDPLQPRKPRKRKAVTPRVRVRPTVPGQLTLFAEAA